MSKKNPTREELRLIVAAGNNEEMKARVEHIYELKSKSNSYTFDVIWHSLWAAFCVVRSALLATGIWDISNEKIKPFCYIVAAIVTGYSFSLQVSHLLFSFL